MWSVGNERASCRPRLHDCLLHSLTTFILITFTACLSIYPLKLAFCSDFRSVPNIVLILIDDMAPLFHVRKNAPPLLLITGDRDLELLGRYEENAYLWRMMQVVGHPSTDLHELQGFNHGQMAGPAHELLLRFVKKISESTQ